MAAAAAPPDDGAVRTHGVRPLLLALVPGLLALGLAGPPSAAEPAPPGAAGATSAEPGLAALLATDPSAHLDRAGHLYFADPAPTDGGATADADLPDVEPAAYPLSQTFLLHSRPGSQRTIYLDFDGVTVTGTQWNDRLPNGTYPGYDRNGEPSFGTGELENIQLIWQHVAEDYAPFDVDVTTQEPAPDAITRTDVNDQVFGTRAAVTNSVAVSTALCDNSCGGIAYVNAFDREVDHARSQPAWVFQHKLYDGDRENNTKAIAEAVSHEVGHNFGVRHDSAGADTTYYAGHAMWAPIMGSSYLKPVTQWSQGEYAGATTMQTNPNDLSVIAEGGAPVLADDAGNTVGTASTSPAGRKLITARTDVDVFDWGVCNGAVTVGASSVSAGAALPANSSPDLDIKLDILNASGAVVASNNPAAAFVDRFTATGLDAKVTADLPSGRYYVRVDGVGVGDPLDTGYSDYASLGAYALDGAPCSGPPLAPAAIGATSSADGTSATVTWTAPPSNGGTPLTGYRVGRTGAATVDTGNVTSYTWTGLTPGTAYTFSVSARNVVGAGPARTFALTTAVPVTLPGAPSITKAKSGKPGGKRTASVTWAAPAADGGSAVTGYRVLVLKKSGKQVKSADVSAGTTSWSTRLRPGRYRFVVLALNAVGTGPQSAPSKTVRAR